MFLMTSDQWERCGNLYGHDESPWLDLNDLRFDHRHRSEMAFGNVI